jgi:AraC-like DNA-binding protein
MNHGNNENGCNSPLEKTNALLKEKMLRYLTEPGDYRTAIENLTLHRRDEINVPENCFYKPIVGLTIQGTKRTLVGTEEFRYGANNCIVTGVDMPSLNYITDASPEKPYLVVSLYLDMQLTTQLAAQIPAKPIKCIRSSSTIAPTDIDVLKAFLRLVDLLEKPEQIPVLAPMIIREIHFRLLTGPQGELLRALNTLGTQSNQVLRAITWMRQNFKESLEVDALANNIHMSPPTFRKHFKTVTSMSPTQYHKRLRLYEAQRMMLEENADATQASYAVGYENPTQFSREYKRLFDDAPLRHVNQLR